MFIDFGVNTDAIVNKKIIILLNHVNHTILLYIHLALKLWSELPQKYYYNCVNQHTASSIHLALQL